jgi:hypothetical protein
VYLCTGILVCRCTCVQVYLCTGVLVYRRTCVQAYLCTGVLVYRYTCVQVYLCTGVLVYRCYVRFEDFVAYRSTKGFLEYTCIRARA